MRGGIFARLVREEAGLLGDSTGMEHHMHTLTAPPLGTCTVNQAAALLLGCVIHL